MSKKTKVEQRCSVCEEWVNVNGMTKSGVENHRSIDCLDMCMSCYKELKQMIIERLETQKGENDDND